MTTGKKIGLFFGSFNPIHVGHLLIASHIIEHTSLEQIWFVVTPHNPLKDKKTLLPDYHRLALVNTAIEGDNRFRASDIEFKLPQPSYTTNTLTYLQEKHPVHQFSLIMGSDTLNTLHKWRNYKLLLQKFNLFIYPRPNFPPLFTEYNTVHITQAPLMEISSSTIRQLIKEKKDFRYFVPDKVYDYIKEMHFYEK